MIFAKHTGAGFCILGFVFLIGIFSYARAVIRQRGLSVVRGYVESKAVEHGRYTIKVWGANSNDIDLEQVLTVKKGQFERVHVGDVYSYSPTTNRWFTYNDDPTTNR